MSSFRDKCLFAQGLPVRSCQENVQFTKQKCWQHFESNKSTPSFTTKHSNSDKQQTSLCVETTLLKHNLDARLLLYSSQSQDSQPQTQNEEKHPIRRGPLPKNIRTKNNTTYQSLSIVAYRVSGKNKTHTHISIALLEGVIRLTFRGTIFFCKPLKKAKPKTKSKNKTKTMFA